jgi:hypothetical protein
VGVAVVVGVGVKVGVEDGVGVVVGVRVEVAVKVGVAVLETVSTAVSTAVDSAVGGSLVGGIGVCVAGAATVGAMTKIVTDTDPPRPLPSIWYVPGGTKAGTVMSFRKSPLASAVMTPIGKTAPEGSLKLTRIWSFGAQPVPLAVTL